MQHTGKEKVQKCPGKTYTEKHLAIVERLELAEYWINQLTILLTGPTNTLKLTESQRLLETMRCITDLYGLKNS